MKMKFILLGGATGFLSGAFGIGGGIIAVPLFLALIEKNIKKATGTSLAIVAPTAFVSLLFHLIANSSFVDVIPAIIIAIGALVAAHFGAHAAHRAEDRFLYFGFALLLLASAANLAGLVHFSPLVLEKSIEFIPLAILGLASGLASAFFGIGGGVIIVPALNGMLGYNVHSAIILSLAAIIPTTAYSAYLHHEKKNVDSRALRYSIPFAIIGSIVGVLLSESLPEAQVKMLFAVLLVGVAILLAKKGNAAKNE